MPELLTEVRSISCDEGDTRKTLWRAHDGTLIESVLMRYPDRITLCVSSQAGCGMACPFCATGQGGLQRNLSTAEIVEQVRLAARSALDGAMGRPGRLSNVVFMGMGEPLANYNRVLAAVKMITAPAPHGLGISARSVTVSTVGLVPAIEKLTAEKMQVRLAVSLHTPDDELRDTLVPVNDRWKIDEVLRAARGLRRHHRSPRLDRVRTDQRDQRSALARRHARRAAAQPPRSTGARQPDPAQPDAGKPVGRFAQVGAGRIRSARPGQGGGLHRPGYPRAGNRRGLRSAGRR